MVPRVLQVLQEQMVIEVNLDQEDQGGKEESEEFQVLWVQKVRPDPLAPRVHLVLQVLRVTVVLVVILVLLGHLVFQVKMDW